MPVITGSINSYDVVDNKRDVSLEFYTYKSPKSPFWNELQVGAPVRDKLHYWWIDKPLPTKTTVKSGHNYTSGALSLFLTSGVGVVVGSIIKVNKVLYRVSAITLGSDDIATLVLLSSSDANHTAGDTVYFVNNANTEGAVPALSDYQVKKQCYNVTQIFLENFKIAATQQNIDRETPNSQFNEELRLRRDRIYDVVGHAVWESPRVVGDETTPRVMGGVYDLISQTDYGYLATATTFSEANINTWLDTMVYDHGADLMGGQLWMKGSTYNSFLALNASAIRVDQSNTTVGRVVNRYVSKKYDVELRVDDYCRSDYITLISPNQVLFRPLQNRALKWEELAKTGDFNSYMLSMEATLEIRNIGACGIFAIS